jgi:ArsR family transcriptional regulator, arsenate/arsenite/antimonite-responsive transcriptional repressor
VKKRQEMKTLLNALKALSDETRLRIINLLYEKELCVCDVMETLQITQAKASRHLIYMKNAGLVTDRKHAQWVYYSISRDEGMKFIDSLVFDNLRKLKQFSNDLNNLKEWLKKKGASSCK